MSERITEDVIDLLVSQHRNAQQDGKINREYLHQLRDWVVATPTVAGDVFTALLGAEPRRLWGGIEILEWLLRFDDGFLGVANVLRTEQHVVDAWMTRLALLAEKMELEFIDALLGELNLDAPNELRYAFHVAQTRLLYHHDLGDIGRTVHQAAVERELKETWLAPTLHNIELDLRHRTGLYGGFYEQLNPQSPEVDETTSIGQLLDSRGWSISATPPAKQLNPFHQGGRTHTSVFDGGPTGDNRWQSIVGRDTTLTRTTPWEAIRWIYVGARGFGAYSPLGTLVAGRLGMGKCLAACVQAAPNASFLDVMDLAATVDWYLVETTSDWFFDIAWDMGLLASTGDRAVMLLTTASD